MSRFVSILLCTLLLVSQMMVPLASLHAGGPGHAATVRPHLHLGASGHHHTHAGVAVGNGHSHQTPRLPVAPYDDDIVLTVGEAPCLTGLDASSSLVETGASLVTWCDGGQLYGSLTAVHRIPSQLRCALYLCLLTLLC